MQRSTNSLDDVRNALASMAEDSRYFSPGSSDYAADKLGRAYIPEISVTPPATRVANYIQPQITTAFTIAVWLKTSVRYGSILKKSLLTSSEGVLQSKTCYDFSVEKISYGEHETTVSQTVINPAAAYIYFMGVDQQTLWQQSRVKLQMEDGKWHHLAVIVNETHVVYAHDAIAEVAISLPRKITDCTGGEVFIGSDVSAGEMVSFRWFPRALSMLELSDTWSAGKPLDDLLSSAGAAAHIPTALGELQAGIQDKVLTICLKIIRSHFPAIIFSFHDIFYYKKKGAREFHR